jgi:adenylate kinase
MIVVLLGPPGVGKGTQGVRLADELEWRHLSTGDLLRDHRKRGTALGDRARGFMDRGELVPDELILDMVRDELRELDGGVIFDGFPRTLPQARGLDRVLDSLDRELDRVLVLEADDEVLVKRLSGRRRCAGCGRIYNVHFDPPGDEGRCDECGDELVHRSDDDPETVRRRLEVYRKQTEPLIAFYSSSSVPRITVDGDQPMDEVQKEIQEAVTEGEAGGEGR